MSEIVQSTIIDYFDTQNAAGVYASTGQTTVPYLHTSNNLGDKEEGGLGPYIKTYFQEDSWNKVDDTRKTVGGAVAHTSEETGAFIVQINVQTGYDNKNLRAQQKVADNIKKDLVKLYLETANGSYIQFGEAFSRQPVEKAERERDGNKTWYQLTVIITYSYLENYT